MVQKEPLPICPACNVYHGVLRCDGDEGIYRRYFVECECGARGARMETPEKARIAWASMARISNWTLELPKIDGWYWIRPVGEFRAAIVYIEVRHLYLLIDRDGSAFGTVERVEKPGKYEWSDAQITVPKCTKLASAGQDSTQDSRNASGGTESKIGLELREEFNQWMESAILRIGPEFSKMEKE